MTAPYKMKPQASHRLGQATRTYSTGSATCMLGIAEILTLSRPDW
jgi:hypothetical protein